MKKIERSATIAMACIAVILLFGSCEANLGNATCDIRIDLDGSRTFSARNIDLEGTAPLDMVSYTLSGTGPGGYDFAPISTTTSSFTLKSIPVGLWEFEAIGFNAETNAIAAGTLQAQITHNTDALTIEMDELVGTGDLAVTVNWDSDQTYGDVDIVMDVKDSTGTVVATLSETKTTNDSQAILSEVGLSAGFYTLEISLSCGTERLGALVETALIIDGTASSATVDLVIGLLADNNGFTIIDKTAKPIEGSIIVDVAEPTVGDTVTLTYTPSLPSGTTIEDMAIQWYCDGQAIVNANSASYVIGSALGGTHRYDVVASIAAPGSVGSAYTLVEAPVTPWIE